MPIKLVSLQATAGFLERCKVDFAPGLTCIIGARGTCKSTLIESIRFAFDNEPDRLRSLMSPPTEAEDPSRGLLSATLKAGSIRCELERNENGSTQRLVLDRELGSDTRVFVDGVREYSLPNLSEEVEIYSQGDLQRMADPSNDPARLALIDRANAPDVAGINKARLVAVTELVEIGPKLRSLRSQMIALGQVVAPLQGIQDRLQTVLDSSPALPPELEKEREAFESRRTTISLIAEVEKLSATAAAHLEGFEQLRDRLEELREKLLAKGPSALEEPLRTLGIALEQVLSARAVLDSNAWSERKGLLTRQFDEDNEPYFKLRQEQQDHNELLKLQDQLQRQVGELSNKRAELDDLRRREVAFVQRRFLLRAEIAKLDDQLYDMRIREIEKINAMRGGERLEGGGDVHLALKVGGAGSQELISKLQVLLGGSRIRQQDEVGRSIAERFNAAEIVDFAESGDGRVLAETLGRDLAQMNRVVAHLGDHVDLYGLEALPVLNKLEITFFDKGEPKRVEELSKGQRATALLPLILRPLPYPLIIDQPEDDLDNYFIFDTLVRVVRSLKVSRQVIFVTHNANIPVLGEADKVVVMRMFSPTLADSPRIGSVDESKEDILNLLEGGAAAFTRREASYHDLLQALYGRGKPV